MAKNSYSDKFVDVMQYAEILLAEKKQRRRIRSDSDLRQLFKEIDASRKGGTKRLSDEFIDLMVKSHSGQAAKGKILPTGEYLNRSGNSSAARQFRIQSKFGGGIKNWRIFNFGGAESQSPVRETVSDKVAERAQAFRQQGRDVYYYTRRNGTQSQAVKSFVRGKPKPQFRDVLTGRFAKVKDDEE